MRRIVTILTDFGTRDHYVAAVKGVLLGLNPNLQLVDISHEVTPFQIIEGSFLLASVFHSFPEGTVHLAVVDPGVGGSRAGLAAATDSYLFVGPDNGLFDQVFALEPPRLAVSLENPEYRLREVSPTFHARDIFAPAAAHLSLGLEIERLGPRISYQRRTPPFPRLERQDELQGEVIHIDHFGNLVTNIEIPFLESCRLTDLEVFLVEQPLLTGPTTYEEAPPGRPVALRGSSAYLEVVVREGSASKVTGGRVGTPVLVRRRKQVNNPGPEGL